MRKFCLRKVDFAAVKLLAVFAASKTVLSLQGARLRLQKQILRTQQTCTLQRQIAIAASLDWIAAAIAKCSRRHEKRRSIDCAAGVGVGGGIGGRRRP